MRTFLQKLLFTVAIGFFINNIYGQADWVKLGSDGKLVYKADAKGNRIMDFSTAGYMKGEAALPSVPVKVTVNAGSGDMATAIQNAINQVSAMPLVNGVRGAVLLGPGTFNISKTININTSGVVLRGSGSGSGGTVISTASSRISPAIKLLGSGDYATSNSVNVQGIANASYIPSGATSFKVSSASAYKVGDPILVYRTVTLKWAQYLKMDDASLDPDNHWIDIGSKIATDRYIKAINGDVITLDGPLTDSYDATYLGTPIATMVKYSFSGRISNVGVENLKTVSTLSGKYSAISVDKVINGWIKDVATVDNLDAIKIEKGVKQFTLLRVNTAISKDLSDSAAPAFFMCVGTQILFKDCKSTGQYIWGVSTGATGVGPIVVLNYDCADRGVTPHARWTTGILVDGGTMTGGYDKKNIRWENRGNMGSGHGWTTAWSVAYNVTTATFICDQAPGTYNWVIGGKGTQNLSSDDPRGIVDHVGTTLLPASLYLQQLKERIGGNTKQDQTITFPALPSKLTTDPDFAAGATASSGLAVSYSSSNTAVATISGSNIHIVGAGTSVITASQAGDETFNAANDVSQTLTVSKQNQTITFNTLPSKVVGDADFNAGATASSGLVVSYNSSNTAVATIVGSNIHIVGVGTSVITASQTGNATYIEAAPVKQTLTVTSATTWYKIKVVNNPTYVLNCAGIPANGTNVNVYSYNGSDAQLWQLVDVGSGYVKIVPRSNINYCLDCSATPANGVNIQLWSYVANTRQQWLKTDLGGGNNKITVRANAAYGIDCSATPANNTNVQVWSYSGNNRQQWILEPVLKSGEIQPETSTVLSLTCTPTYVTENTVVNYAIAVDALTSVVVYNMFGQKVKDFGATYQKAGEYTLVLDAANLAGGMHIVRLVSGKSESTCKIMVK